MANKRAREEVAVSRFDAVDLEQFSLKDRGENAKGDRAVPQVAGEPVSFNLTPSGWLKSLYGFDLDCKYNRPSFLCQEETSTEEDKKKKPNVEGLYLRVHLEQKEAEFLQRLDAKCKIAYTGLVKDCSKWSDLVALGNMMCPCSVRIFVPLKANSNTADLTEIAVVTNNTVARGEGWDFLEPYHRNFRNADVKLTVRIKRVWHLDGGAGLTLEATQLALRVQERPRQAVAFTDEDLLA